MFDILIICPKTQETAVNKTTVFLSGAGDGNRTRMDVSTRPSNVRVYQFRHSRVKYIIPLSPEFVKGYFEKTPEKLVVLQ